MTRPDAASLSLASPPCRGVEAATPRMPPVSPVPDTVLLLLAGILALVLIRLGRWFRLRRRAAARRDQDPGLGQQA